MVLVQTWFISRKKERKKLGKKRQQKTRKGNLLSVGQRQNKTCLCHLRRSQGEVLKKMMTTRRMMNMKRRIRRKKRVLEG